MIEIEDLESEFDSNFQEYICDWKYTYSYRFCINIFQKILINDYYFNIFLDNKQMIEEVIQEVRKELNDILNDLPNYESEYDYLESQGEEFSININHVVNRSKPIDYKHWEEIFGESFYDFIQSSIEELKEVHEACFQFLEDFRNRVIEKVFEE